MSGRTVTAALDIGDRLTRELGETGSEVAAPILHVMIFVGLLFVIANYALSRLSRRLETRESRRIATVRSAPRVSEAPPA